MARITLFEHSNGRGRSYVVTEEIAHTRDIGLHDAVTYVEVQSGAWILYEHINFEGSIFVVMEGEKRNLTGWNDKLSSLKPLSIPRDIGSPSCSIYQHINFDGRCMTLRDDMAYLGWYEFNDEVSSIIVHQGIWVGYQHAHFKGNQYLLPPGRYRTYKEAGIKNDDLSSFRPVKVINSGPVSVVKLEFDLTRGVLNQRPTSIFSWTQSNYTSVEQKVQATSTKAVTKEDTYQFNWQQGASVTAESSLTMGIPMVGSAGLKLGLTATYNIGETRTTRVSKTEQWELTYPSVIPPKKTVILTSIGTEGRMNVPFTAVMRQGNHTWAERGTFIGTQYYGFKTEFKELDN